MKKKITLYNHWLRFNDKAGNFSRIDEDRTHWTANRKLAEERMKRDVDWVNSNAGYVDLVDYGIVEKEHPTKVVLAGELGDNEETYEDFQITVGGTSLYRALYEKYCGCNVKLTVEIFP